MAKVTEALHNFLLARKKDHNGPDLIDNWGPSFETQVLVNSQGGDPVEGRRNTFTDGKFTWFNIRVPKKANTEPEWFDYELTWPLDYYAQGIGTTGWDWNNKVSRRVGFDFDAIVGHAAGVGVSDEQLQEIRNRAMALDYAEVRKSTGGMGLHIWVTIDSIPTENHTLHAALARNVLQLMSADCGFDFSQAVDACGGNLWIWHSKADEENEGLKLIKAATKKISESDLPANWRDHADVISKKRAKVRVAGIPEGELDEFEKLTTGRTNTPLDDSHRLVLKELAEAGASCVWVSDYHLAQTHTYALKQVHEKLKLKGFFDTSSEGTDLGQPNCFIIPKPDGAWFIARFSQGVHEHPVWNQDGQGYTTASYNITPTLGEAAAACGASENEHGHYIFETLEAAARAIEGLGVPFKTPPEIAGRAARLKKSKDGRVILLADWEKDDPSKLEGFLLEGKRVKTWQKVISVKAERADNSSIEEAQEYVRSVMSASRERLYYTAIDSEGQQIRGSKDDAKSVLMALGHPRGEADQILGVAAFRPWTSVSLPFCPEYTGDRRWNQNAAQLRHQPVDLDYDEKPHHPHWDMILSHLGGDLDEAIANLSWCDEAGIKSGRDYLTMWIACVIREPFEPLPYLFFFGPQNSGKSISHEAMSLLISPGVTSADRALTSGNDFNSELEGSVVCVVEEKDISKSPHSYNRIKEWVTAKKISIRKMRTDSYDVPNTTHWVQCANDQGNCPIERGDTRINVIHVPALEDEIPKATLLDSLDDEAPHFLRTLFDIELPRISSRLRLPVIENSRKEKSIEIQKSSLQLFIDELCHESPGHYTLFSDFKKWFLDYLEPIERTQWNQSRISRELPDRYPTARRGNNRTAIGNLTLTPIGESHAEQRVTVHNGKFVPDYSGKYDQ